VPRYLEEINPAGMLLHEFDSIFHDIFTRSAESYREIVRTLVSGQRSADQISAEVGRSHGGTLSDSRADLEQVGFITRDIPFELESGRSHPRDARFRLSDNYLRFYLKYVDPVKARIGLDKKLVLNAARLIFSSTRVARFTF